jgi:hypothetical protein
MPGRRYYQSRFLVTGVSLLVLGAGNVLIGSQKLAQYQHIVAEGRARGYFPDTGTSSGVLRPVDDEGERYNIGRAKVDLYHVVLSGGLLMLGLGTILTAAAWVRVRVQRDTALPVGRAPLPDAPPAPRR